MELALRRGDDGGVDLHAGGGTGNLGKEGRPIALAGRDIEHVASTTIVAGQ